MLLTINVKTLHVFIVCLAQELAADPSVAPFICGAAFSDAPLFPGETWRGALEVDEAVCGDDAVISVVTMLSEFAALRKFSSLPQYLLLVTLTSR